MPFGELLFSDFHDYYLFLTAPDPCDPNPCQNNGTCTAVPDVIGQFTCTCLIDFTGDNCEIVIGKDEEVVKI